MPRSSDAREKLLTAARALLVQRAYSALGVAEICAAADVPKGSFYYFFNSKQALALAVIDEHWAEQRAQWEQLLSAPRPPLERLHDVFAAIEAALYASKRDRGAVVGCLFGNLALELSTQSEEIRARLEEIFDKQIAMIEQVIVQARDAGDASPADPHEAARSVVAQLEGQVLFAKLLNAPDQIEAVWRNSLSILGAKQPAASQQQT
ncbi:MAG TPA: TetR/AcrR family transcriptional regulator [Conexibacter sp.]|jgi:TetR/AcrR family transcriptional repressor of nem operon